MTPEEMYRAMETEVRHRLCKGCSQPIVQARASGRRRIWCSNRCRKQALYGGTCEQCGAVTSGEGARLCRPCALVHTVEAAKQRSAALQPKYKEAVDAWNDGAHRGTVAQILGIELRQVGPKLAKLRQLHGYDVKRRLGPGSRSCKPRGLTAKTLERDAYIEMRWSEGATLKELAEELGTTVSHVGNLMRHARQRGCALAYRKKRSLR